MSNLDKFNFSETEINSKLPSQKKPPYLIDEALYHAVKVAVLLKQPLLLTGKPGTGKTMLAHKLALDLSSQFSGRFLDEPLIFHTKTGSVYADLLYSYDALGHFQAVNIHKEDKKVNVQHYIQLQPLGQAIMLSAGKAGSPYHSMKALEGKFKTDPGETGSVVLIDEVDKAPRDFTNDLLNELDQMEFTVKEDENTVYEKGAGNILVILTSNSEKSLPDAFLRRCVFYHIDPPKDELLRDIILARLFASDDHTAMSSFVMTYVDHFNAIRQKITGKEPATAELLSWVFYLKNDVIQGKELSEIDKRIRDSSYSILAKNTEDLETLKRLF